MPREALTDELSLLKQASEAIISDSAQLEAVFSSMGEGIIATDSKGIISRVNKVALKILGYKKEELIGKKFSSNIIALHDNGKPYDIFSRPITRAVIEGRIISERTNYRNKRGKSIPVFITVSPIIFEGRPIGAIEVFRDLSQEIESEKLKSDFISIASHQLRTPLSAIHMYTRMLQDGMAGELTPRQLEFTETVLGSVERMNGLIDTLLNITRIEAGNIEVKPKKLQLDTMLDEIVKEFLPLAESKNLKTSLKVPDNFPEVESDPLLIKEVFSNIISNAMKYTPDGGSIKISLNHGPKCVDFEVKDTGYGIPRADHKKIFTKFFRAENISDKDVSGTGLGLYLTKTIVERIGGELTFKSSPGKGSTFKASFPGKATPKSSKK